MKKITFILFALIAGTSFAQVQTATGTADVNADIVSPIQITDGTALNFGSINGTSIGGDVTVNTSGNRNFANSEMAVTTATAISSASFEITAANNFSYSISIPQTTLEHEGGTGDNMTVKHIYKLGEEEEIFAGEEGTVNGIGTGNGAKQTLKVGGVLTVNDSQDSGSYTGTVSVTVAYE